MPTDLYYNVYDSTPPTLAVNCKILLLSTAFMGSKNVRFPQQYLMRDY